MATDHEITPNDDSTAATGCAFPTTPLS